jgi:hypothetical protein
VVPLEAHRPRRSGADPLAAERFNAYNVTLSEDQTRYRSRGPLSGVDSIRIVFRPGTRGNGTHRGTGGNGRRDIRWSAWGTPGEIVIRAPKTPIPAMITPTIAAMTCSERDNLDHHLASLLDGENAALLRLSGGATPTVRWRGAGKNTALRVNGNWERC